jgi:hypothetical protein
MEIQNLSKTTEQVNTDGVEIRELNAREIGMVAGGRTVDVGPVGAASSVTVSD